MEREKVCNKKLDRGELEKQREKVLDMWQTRKFSLEEGIAYNKSLAREKRMNEALAEAKKQGRIVLSGHGGRATMEENIKLFLSKESYVDYLRCSTDSHTRNLEFKEAEEALEESRRTGKNLLNGIPVVAYGVDGIRQLVEAVHKPVEFNTGPDSRLYAEIALAGGMTGFSGNHPVIYTTYNRDVPWSVFTRNWQYVERLAGIYTEMGAPITRELPVVGVGCVVPGSLFIVYGVLTSLEIVEQGVKVILNSYPVQCNILEFVAVLRTARKLVKEYLVRFGYHDVEVYQQAGSPCIVFPIGQPEALGLSAATALIAALAGADAHFAYKTADEGRGLPSIEKTVELLRLCRTVLDVYTGQQLPESKELKLEMEMMEKEARLILERILELGDGDILVGAGIAQEETGELDLPFAPNRLLKSKVLPARDKNGFARFYDCGDLPFTSEIKEFHREKLVAKTKAKKQEMDIYMVIEDVLAGMFPS